MEFTVGEMEGKKLELSFQDKIFSENVNQADSSVKSDVSIAEGTI